ncbi:MAG: hypothetical protein JNM24_18735 [Bdellovibrionaceae bacterium]|nr:hypothetical protein [Pseudobdellovibrionaceae bacterium]
MKPLLLSILLSIGALANTTELILTCSDNNIPTMYGEARINLDIFQIRPGTFSSIIEIIVEGQPTKRFKQPNYKVDPVLEGEILIPVGQVVEIAENGTETLVPGAHIGFTYLTSPQHAGGTAFIKFQPSRDSDLIIEYSTLSCHQP